MEVGLRVEPWTGLLSWETALGFLGPISDDLERFTARDSLMRHLWSSCCRGLGQEKSGEPCALAEADSCRRKVLHSLLKGH